MAAGDSKEDRPLASDNLPGDELLELLYDELRALARSRMQHQAPGQTIQATALVHEAYLRLTSGEEARHWDGPGHFFAAAAIAMRNVLVDRARARSAAKRGGGSRAAGTSTWKRLDVLPPDVVLDPEISNGYGAQDLVALDAALSELEDEEGTRRVTVVNMRVFAGMTIEQIALALGVTSRTIDRDWRYARAWLYDRIGRELDADV